MVSYNTAPVSQIPARLSKRSVLVSIIFRVQTRRAAARRAALHIWTPPPALGRHRGRFGQAIGRDKLDLPGPAGVGMHDRPGLWRRLSRVFSRLRDQSHAA